jgi:uncharacterized OB-fold protein
MLKRVIPVPTEETLPFWQAAARSVLRLPRCQTCSIVLYPPRARCPGCLDTKLEWIDIAPRATLLSWSEVSIAGPGGLSAPFTVARAALDDAAGTVLACNLVGIASPGVGQALRIEFAQLEESDFAIPQFAPLEHVA